ncbi:MAG TPA: hypothetical protein VG245_06765, partial [Candidatus Dormibacteraeota bacterium]|nr:hypothetical protein [Candidatus Dormibacteraeota bacterium]
MALASGVSASAAGAAGQAVGRQADGSVVTSTNQRLTPAGQQVEWRAGRPTAVTLSPDGTTAAFLNGDGLAGPEVVTVNLASGAVTNLDPGSEAGSFDGIAYSPDGATIYAADAGGTLQVIPASGGQVSSIAMPGSNPDPGGLALSPDGGTAYVALSRN